MEFIASVVLVICGFGLGWVFAPVVAARRSDVRASAERVGREVVPRLGEPHLDTGLKLTQSVQGEVGFGIPMVLTRVASLQTPVPAQESSAWVPIVVDAANAAASLAATLSEYGFYVPGQWSPLRDHGPQPGGATFGHIRGMKGFWASMRHGQFKAYFIEVPECHFADFGRQWPYCWDEGYFGALARGERLCVKIYRTKYGLEQRFQSILEAWSKRWGIPAVLE